MPSLKYLLWVVITFVSALVCVNVQSKKSNLHNSLRRKLDVKASFNANKNERHLQGYVVTLRLYNAVTNTSVTDLIQNQVVNIGSTPPGSLTIQAFGEGFDSKSARFILTGATTIRNTEGYPYLTLCKNDKENFFPCKDLKLGKYNIRVKFFSKSYRRGTLVTTKSIDFELRGVTPRLLAPSFAPVSLKTSKKPTVAPTNKPTMAPVFSPSSAPVSSCTKPKVRICIIQNVGLH
jgi:hypothetical protein